MPHSFKEFKNEISEIYNSIQSSIVDRISSPFAWSFIISWCIHNWRLVYGFFNFDAACNLECRYAIISNYINEAGRDKLLIHPLEWSLLGVLFFLIFHALYAGIYLFYKRWALPIIHYCIDEKALVTREEYSRLVKLAETKEDTISNFASELYGLRTQHSELKTLNDQSEIRIAEKENLIKALTEENKKYNTHNIVPHTAYHDVVQGTWDMQAIYPENQSLHTGLEIKNESTTSNPTGRYVILKISNSKNPYAGEKWICIPITHDHIIVYGIHETSEDQYKAETRLFLLTRSPKLVNITGEEL